MQDIEQLACGRLRNGTDGFNLRRRPLTEEEWIGLMNKHDRLSQYAEKRQEESGEE